MAETVRYEVRIRATVYVDAEPNADDTLIIELACEDLAETDCEIVRLGEGHEDEEVDWRDVVFGSAPAVKPDWRDQVWDDAHRKAS